MQKKKQSPDTIELQTDEARQAESRGRLIRILGVSLGLTVLAAVLIVAGYG